MRVEGEDTESPHAKGREVERELRGTKQPSAEMPQGEYKVCVKPEGVEVKIRRVEWTKLGVRGGGRCNMAYSSIY
jgi:hypothetical protein